MADKLITELKTLENEFKSAIERNDVAATERLNNAIADVESKMKAIEIAANRPAAGEVVDANEVQHKSAFESYLRTSNPAKLNEYKAAVMSASVQAEGGFTVPKIIEANIQKRLVDVSPLRKLARVVSISTPDYHIPFSVGGTKSMWVGEKDARPQTDASSLVDIVPPVGELFASPLVTQQILEDSQFDIAGYVTDEIATEFARAEGAAFVAGDGVNKPKGLMSQPTAATADGTRAFGTVQAITGGTSGLISAADLITLTMTLKAGYRQNAAFLLNKATLGAVRGLTDNTGAFLWQTSYQLGIPSSLLGFPVYEMEDMAGVTAGNLAVAFGDFNRAYTIVDRVGTSMLYDNISVYPYIAFKTRKRVGGTPVDTEAVKFLKIKA